MKARVKKAIQLREVMCYINFVCFPQLPAGASGEHVAADKLLQIMKRKLRMIVARDLLSKKVCEHTSRVYIGCYSPTPKGAKAHIISQVTFKQLPGSHRELHQFEKYLHGLGLQARRAVDFVESAEVYFRVNWTLPIPT